MLSLRKLIPLLLVLLLVAGFLPSGVRGKMMAGGFTEAQEMNEEVAAIAVGLKGEIQENLGQEFETFEPLSYMSQVVAGTNYMIKIQVGEGSYVHAKVHEPLPHKNEAPRLMEASIADA